MIRAGLRAQGAYPSAAALATLPTCGLSTPGNVGYEIAGFVVARHLSPGPFILGAGAFLVPDTQEDKDPYGPLSSPYCLVRLSAIRVLTSAEPPYPSATPLLNGFEP